MTILPAVRVIAVFGPTGVGKTAVADALAQALRARGEDPVAVSADAMQVYRGLPILTGAADAAPHTRLIGFVPIEQTFSAGAFAEHAHETIDGLIAAGPTADRRRRHRPVPAGGAGRPRPPPAGGPGDPRRARAARTSRSCTPRSRPS